MRGKHVKVLSRKPLRKLWHVGWDKEADYTYMRFLYGEAGDERKMALNTKVKCGQSELHY